MDRELQLGRASSFAHDAADRETVATFPGSRDVYFGYDANGNLTRITPPASAASHRFAYTDVDLSSTYTPPGVSGILNPATSYEFNDDRQLTRITRPDTVVTLDYDSDGRLWKIHHTQDVSESSYTSPSTGQVHAVTVADGTVVTEDYDGPLLK
jgi:YD repeat-containing protein